LLGHTRVPFTILTKHTEEHSEASDPRRYVLEIAQQKGQVVCEGVTDERVVVVSADTIVEQQGKIFGKPRDNFEAEQFLRELSGREHNVHTAVVVKVRISGKWCEISHVESTIVQFHQINERLLSDYVQSGDALDKAGAYGIQGQALTFIARINGCYANVVGFPLSKFCLMMDRDFRKMIGGDKPWQDYF
ncbi:MAG: nucleoside triphosphate pyrophosphatase, partial [Bacteroidota bacterium]